MIDIRPAEPDDLDAYYSISLLTADCGGDATALYDDPKLNGHIYSAPYLVHAPGLCLTAVDQGRVVGYCVGTPDTERFAQTLERHWWPGLRAAYPVPDPARCKTLPADAFRIAHIHHPEGPPRSLVKEYPAHVHMNLLPDGRGRHVGSRLLRDWFAIVQAMGVGGVHLGANRQNYNGIAFWRRQGFEPVPGMETERSYWMRQKLQEPKA